MIREGGMSIPFRFAAGEAGSAFLAALRDDRRILGARCRGCGRVVVPARAFCGRCGGTDLAFEDVGPEGTLIAWTQRPGHGVFGLIRLDGGDGALLHRLLSPLPALVAGVRLRPRFAAERRGDIRDIEGFEVVNGSDA